MLWGVHQVLRAWGLWDSWVVLEAQGSSAVILPAPPGSRGPAFEVAEWLMQGRKADPGRTSGLSMASLRFRSCITHFSGPQQLSGSPCSHPTVLHPSFPSSHCCSNHLCTGDLIAPPVISTSQLPYRGSSLLWISPQPCSHLHTPSPSGLAPPLPSGVLEPKDK